MHWVVLVIRGKKTTCALSPSSLWLSKPSLNAYYVSSTVKPQAFRLEPLKGMLYIITTEEVEVLQPKPKTFNLYGE